MPTKLPIWDRRMFELMDHCISNKSIKTQGDFMKLLKISATSTIKQIRDGKQSFRHQHLSIAAKRFGVSMDWFYGFTDDMRRTGKETTAADLAQQLLTKLKSK